MKHFYLLILVIASILGHTNACGLPHKICAIDRVSRNPQNFANICALQAENRKRGELVVFAKKDPKYLELEEMNNLKQNFKNHVVSHKKNHEISDVRLLHRREAIRNLFLTINLREKIPPIKNELLKVPGVKLADMIRNQVVKCEVVIQAYIDRCKEVNPLLNAIVEDRFEDALNEAREIDKQIRSGNKTIEEMKLQTPLLGLPLTVKESIQVKGMSNQAGRVYKKKRIATEDAPIVKNARKHGAVIICVTNTPELCLCWETYNKVSGTTRNPYDVKRTPGGSSGGEAALLGSGASLLGLGSDVAGSCRLPAMFVGVYGHKPTPFVCSPYGHNPQSEDPRWGTFFTTAPMTRYAEDLSLLLDAVKEADGPNLELFKEIDVNKINYHYMIGDPSGVIQQLSPCMKDSLLKIANHFKATEVNIALMKWALDISMHSMLTMPFDTIYTKTEEGCKPKTPGTEIVKYMTGRSKSNITSVLIRTFQYTTQKLPKNQQKQLENIRNNLRTEVKKIVDNNGVLFYPTFPSSANKHYEIYYKLLDTTYLMVFNTLGLPVTQVNTGFDKNNLPIGIQVVTNHGNDHLSIAVAREIERKFGGWIPAEDIEMRKTKEITTVA